MIIRLQDTEGRGPWRPGFSHLWISPDGPDLPPPIYDEIRDFKKIVAKSHNKGLHVGSAVFRENLNLWFLPEELEKLFSLGFGFVDCSKCEVIAETPSQLLIASFIPFRLLPKYNL